LIGIGWDFHVDAVTYVDSMDFFRISDVGNFYELSNNLHYYVVSLLGGIEGTIAYNIFLTAISNQIIYTVVVCKIRGRLKFLMILYLFNPYKMHLSVTLLKDSAVILFLTLVFFTRFSIIGMIFGGLYRNAFIIYMVLYKSIARWYYFSLLLLFVIYFVRIGGDAAGLEDQITGDMTFRDFDLVPNFTQYGAILGGILRLIIWPLITITGLFFILSPTVAYLPLFLGSISLLFVIYKMKIKIHALIPFFSLIAFFALITPGFTTFYRYAFPIITLLPYILVVNKKK
jgi:hypothetical protein